MIPPTTNPNSTLPAPAPRRVSARRWALAGTAISLALAGTAPTPVAKLLVTPAHASDAAEAGEAGESGVDLAEGPSAFLTSLGYFEGTYRIAARLYLDGHREGAAAHLDESHHAFYEDIETYIAEYSAPGFAPEAEAFTAAIMQDQGDETVRATYDALMARVATNAAAAKASAYDQAISVHDLIELAAAEYEGGVDAGEVVMAIEYRDSWGFFETARVRAEAFTQSGDDALATAGKDILEHLAAVDALYPSLTSETASPDAADLVVAAGWSEMIALRLK